MVRRGEYYAGARCATQDPYGTRDTWGNVIPAGMNPVMARRIEERMVEERARYVKAELDAKVARQDRLWPDDYLYDEEG